MAEKNVNVVQGRLGWEVGDITTVKPEKLTPHPKSEEIYGKDEKIPETFYESIKEKGVIEPLIIKKNKKIISGHRRWRAAKKAGLDKIPARIAEFNSELEEREALIELNRQRNKTFSQKMKEAEEVEEIYRKKHKNRMSEGGRGGNISIPSKTRDDVAKEIGIGSGRQYDKAKKVWNKAEEGDEKAQKLVKKLDRGKETITSAHRTISWKETKEKQEVPDTPDGEYNIILADPPWNYSWNRSRNRDVENQYPTMAVSEIKNLDIPAGENSVLFLWATAPKLDKAIQVLEKWGFEYKTCAVWDKEKIGMGYWFRGQHELILVGKKGKFSPPKPEDRISSVIREERKKHSKKPKIHEYIEKWWPKGNYLELFAREERENWTVWGDEIGN